MMTATLSREEHLKRFVSFGKISMMGTSITVIKASIQPISSLLPPTFRMNSIMKLHIMLCVKYSTAVPTRNSMKRLFSRANSRSELGFSALCSTFFSGIERCALSPGLNSSVAAPSSAANTINTAGTAFSLTRCTSIPSATLHTAYANEPSARARLKLMPQPQLSM